MLSPLPTLRSWVKRFVFALVDRGGRSPFLVLGAALVLLAACWTYASKLEIRSDVMELLPRDSPGFMAFEHRLARVGGRATITLVSESPDRSANERFIDAVTASLRTSVDERATCLAKCGGNARCVEVCGGPEHIAFIESGSKEAREFFQTNKWLYADLKELEEADATLDHQIAIQSGMVDDLESDANKPAATLGMNEYEEKWKRRAEEHDSFPTGYFASADGTRLGIWIISNGSGMGGAEDDALLVRVQRIIDDLRPSSFHPAMKVGLGGDIPNAKAEKDSLIGEVILATSVAAALILVGIAWFYGSLWSIPIVFFPPLFGVGCAYAFATAKYGFVNSSGAFLGAIILGNGVNYPIVLYSRYREFRARGMTPDVARREAVWNAFRAELVGASVASIAYGSLTVTRFRGFSQFGIIGFVGMLLVWISMIPCLPALVVVFERLQARLPPSMRESPACVADDGSRGSGSRLVGNATARWPRVFVGVAVAVTLIAVWKLPGFLRDPWEYDFDKLGSKGARTTGAFQWTEKADAIIRGRKTLEGAVVLADKPEQVLLVKQRILANDAADPKGSLIDAVNTIWDYLPGTAAEQDEKLAVLTRMRERITPGVLARMSDDEAKKLRDMTPPETLRRLAAEDLPSSIKRRFQERDGTIGTPFYVDFKPGVSTNDGHTLLRIAATVDGIVLPDGTRVDTASRFTVFAEMIRSLERDGPLATGVSFVAVVIVVLLATWSKRGAFAVILILVTSVTWTIGFAALFGGRLNFLNFIALPITFGIGSEYPFNIYDRSRLLGGDVTSAVKLHLGAVALCSYTTVIGYGSLLFADNQALQSFGKLSISGEIACVLGALLFLPALLHVMRSISASRVPRPGSRSTDR
jgi:predicted RND superfamily exporter protein